MMNLDGLRMLVKYFQEERARELETGKCSRCGAQLSVAWPPGRKEGTSTEPYIYCGPCLEREID
jgi:DNA-directed RNA polymerase subunit RPC12/RpoP